MKKFISTLAVTLLSVGMMGGIAAADTTCSGDISNTGPGSTNTVTCVDSNQKQVSCVNNVVVDNSNDQTATSGGAFTVGNTSGGSSTTGDSGNTNTTVVELGVSCAPVVATTTPTTPTPPAGGSGGGHVEGAQVTAVPAGSVHAGGGAGTAKNVSLLSVGLIGSAGLAAVGTVLRKRSMSL